MNGEEWTSTYLEHHGVKGMRWGVVKEKRQERRERIQVKRDAKAQKYLDKASGFQSNIDQAVAGNKRSKNRVIAKNYEKKQQALADAKKKREGKLTDKQRKIAIGATAAAVIIGSYVTYQSINSGNARRLTEKGKMFVNGRNANTSHPWKIDHSLADKNMNADAVMSKVVQHVNPGYGRPGTKMNCRRATMAYEMRRRGYDVAATRTPTGRGQTIVGMFNATNPGVNNVSVGQRGYLTRVLSESVKNTRKGTAKPFTEYVKGGNSWGRVALKPPNVHDHLSKMPVGARGELGVKWLGGGGHSVAWERFKDGVTVFDTQSGRKYSGIDELQEMMSMVSDAGVTRLDNLPLDRDFLLRWVKNA